MNKSQAKIYATLKVLGKRKEAAAKAQSLPDSSFEAVIQWQKSEDQKTASQKCPAVPSEQD
jgi:hypothetical protein